MLHRCQCGVQHCPHVRTVRCRALVGPGVLKLTTPSLVEAVAVSESNCLMSETGRLLLAKFHVSLVKTAAPTPGAVCWVVDALRDAAGLSAG